MRDGPPTRRKRPVGFILGALSAVGILSLTGHGIFDLPLVVAGLCAVLLILILAPERNASDENESGDACLGEEFSTLCSALEETVFTLDRNGLINSWNGGKSNIFGYTESEAVGSDACRLLFRGVDKQDLPAGMTGRLHREDSKTKITASSKNGNEFTCELSFLDTGNMFLGIAGDASCSREARNTLIQSEKRYRLLAENVQDVIMTLDMYLRYTYLSPSIENLRGYSVAEAISQPLRLTLVPESYERMVGVLSEEVGRENRCPNRQDDRTRTIELEYFRRDGTTVWTEATASFIRNHRGVPEGILLVVRNIDERKKAADSIRKYQEELEDMVRARTAELENTLLDLKLTQSKLIHSEKMASVGQIAAGIAHEINNPIGFVMSNLGSLQKYVRRMSDFVEIQADVISKMEPCGETAAIEEARDGMKMNFILEDASQLITESVDGTQRVAKIVRDLKGFSRVSDSGRGPTDINECLESTLNIIWNELKYKTTIRKDYGELPITFCDAQQLNQVFMNLLINAVHAIDEKGEISIKTWSEDDHILVEFRDTGCGIPGDIQERIFEPFFTTKEVGQGTGLGLSISYDIIKKHNGDIDVSSEPGRGTTFTVKIPVEHEKTTESKAETA